MKYTANPMIHIQDCMYI